MSSPPEEQKPQDAVQALRTDTESSSDADLQRMFSELTDRIGDEPPRARTAALSTPVRYALAFALSLSIPLGLWLAHGQLLPATFSLPRQLTVLAAYAIIMGPLLLSVLRPLHRPLLPRPVLWLQAIAPFILVFAMALWPTDVPAATALPAHSPVPCLLFGTTLGLSLYLLLRYLDRGQPLGPLLGAASATVVANAALQVGCADASVAHRLQGHAGVGLLFLLGLCCVHLLRRHQKQRST